MGTADGAMAQELKTYTLTVTAEPAIGGTFNTQEATLTAGEQISLSAWAASNFSFDRWVDASGNTIATTQTFTYAMPPADATVTARFVYNPANPVNPATNHWDPQTGTVIIDDFEAGRLSGAISTAIKGANSGDVSAIIVSGVLGSSDFNITNYYSGCRLLDLSRVSGLEEVPSYAFDYTTLESVYLPASTESIGYRAFYNCKELASVTVYAMIPPTLGTDVFTGVPDGLVVYAPAAAIPMYQEAPGWEGFTFLPIQEDIKTLTVKLPADASAADYENMWLELTNTKSGQKMHYVMNGLSEYTFSNVIRDTSWRVTVRNERGDEFGVIESVEVKDEDVSVTIPSLAKPQTVSVRVYADADNEVTSQTRVTWTDSKGNHITTSPSVSGLPAGMSVNYRVELPQVLAMTHERPADGNYVINDEDNTVSVMLSPLGSFNVSGRVVSESTGLPLKGASVSASQTFGGKYSSAIGCVSDKEGCFTMEVSDVPTVLTISADEHINMTVDCDTIRGKVNGAIETGDVTLRPISGAVLTLRLSYIGCVDPEADDDTPGAWHTDHNNIGYSVYNRTRNEKATEISVQYPQIVVMDDVTEGDELEVTASSKSGAFMQVSATAIVTADLRGEVTLAIVEPGMIRATYSDSPTGIITGSLYDRAGKLVKTQQYSGGVLSIANLPDGDYTLVTMSRSELLNNVSDMSRLSQLGLTAGTDYLSDKVTVKSGHISVVAHDEVPMIDETKLYYTGSGTSFTANKSSLVIGNYLTLTGKLDFKADYAVKVSNVSMIIDLPEGCTFVENSVMAGNSVASYSKEGNRLTVPMARYTDRVRFCVIPTEGTEYAAGAYAEFDLSGKKVIQPIGTAKFSAENLAITVPSVAADATFPVSGTAVGTSQIEIYDGSTLIGQTTSMANGTWATTCQLVEPYNLSRHDIHVKATTKAGLELTSDHKSLTYDINAIKVSKVTMYHWNPEIKSTQTAVFDFLNPKTTPTQWTVYYPNKKFTYTVEFTRNDPEVISNVVLYVHTADGQYVPCAATYDEQKGMWYTELDMGSSYGGYYPVNCSVDFDYRAEKLIDMSEAEDFSMEVEALANNFESDRKTIEEFIDNAEELDYDSLYELTNSLSIPIAIDSSDDTDMPEGYESWTSEQLESYLDQELAQCTVENDELIGTLAYLDTAFELQNEFEVNMDGVFFKVESCEGLTSAGLLADGFMEYGTTSGGKVYIKSTENTLICVDPEHDMYVETNIPQIQAQYRYAPQWVKTSLKVYNDCMNAIESTMDFINAAWSNLLEMAKFPEEKIDEAIKKLESQIKKAAQYKRMSKASNKITKWASEEKRLTKALSAAKLAKKICGPLVRKLLKAVPFFGYVSTLTDCYQKSNKTYSLYKRIPDPCPADPAGAEECKTLCYSSWTMIASLATIDVAGRFSSDSAIVGGVIASLASAGTSLVGSAVGVVTKALIGIGCVLADGYLDNQLEDLSYKVNKLKCEPEPDPDPDGDGGNNNNNGGGAHPSGSPNNSVRIDPSGFVYEAVESNRLEGVKATIFYKETKEDMYGDPYEEETMWDAEEYAQENPLFTDAEGGYRWDVPQGLWQVRFEKAGYESTRSEWLPVPPPQLEVNIGMKQNVQPVVKKVSAYEDAIEVEFDKYMDATTLDGTNITVTSGGKPAEGSLSLLDESIGGGDDAGRYASRVRFEAATAFATAEVTVNVSRRVKSYAGIRMQDDYSQMFTVEPELRRIVCDPLITVGYGQVTPVSISVEPAVAAAGKTLRVTSVSPAIMGILSEELELDTNGRCEAKLTGELPGQAGLLLEVIGHDVNASATVKVVNMDVTATPTASIASGSHVAAGTELLLACATPGASIYYTTDGSCPCDPAARILYDGTPIILNKDVTVRAMAESDDLADSDIAEFTYYVSGDVGLEQINADEALQVWPTPMTDRLNVTRNDGKQIICVTLTNASGANVANRACDSDHVTLNVGHLSSGVYILTVTMTDGVETRKIIKL